MARPPQFHISAVADLFSQLRYAPPETRLRQMDNAEQLATEIDVDQTYPREYVVFRITGYREERATESENLAGEALLGDLVAFVQRLSRSVSLPPDHDARTAIPLGDLPARLRVSERTIKRYRRQGLVCHFVDFSADARRLGCFEDALQRFLDAHASKLDRAAAFTRVDRAVEESMIDEARALRRAERVSLNRAAQILAARHERAHETVRGILRRHDRAAAEPIFTERGPLLPHERSIISRASRFSVRTERLSRRFGRTATTIQRVINEDREAFLRSLRLDYVKLPTFELDDAERVILSGGAVTTHLDQTLPTTFAIQLIEAAKRGAAHGQAEEDAILAAYNFLKRQAAVGLHRPAAALSAGALDEIETKLRWAALLKRRAVSLGFRTAVIAIERNLHKPLSVQPAETIVAMLRLATEVLSRTIETIDPSEGQSIERVGAFAMDRALATRASPLAEARAAARHEAGGIALGDLLGDITPWQRRLGLRADLIGRLDALDEHDPFPLRELVELRFGLGGGPPQSLAALSKRYSLTPTHVSRRLRRAMNELRAARR